MGIIGRAEPLSAGGLATAATIVGAASPELWTVITVETSGRGFLPDRRPVILFERHEFRRRTGGRFDATHPGISGPPGGYGPAGAHQHDRLLEAISCDRRAALESASWGLGQVMGYNAPAAGFADAETMSVRMTESEDEQIAGMARFIRTGGLHLFLQRHDWAGFARHYNGPSYTQNAYDTKLAQAHARLSQGDMPDLRLRAAQLLLSYQGFDPGPIDGRMGQRTEAALRIFRARHGLAGSGGVDDAVLAALRCQPMEAAAAPDPTPAPALAMDVRLVQRLLSACGFDPGGADGRPGPATSRAVAAFRQRARLPAGDAIDGALLDALREAVPNAPISRASVLLAQDLLGRIGLDPGTPDGLWGPRTRAAIRRLNPSAGVADRLDGATLRLLLDRAVRPAPARALVEAMA